ncbi:DNA repair helicase [Sistotremastrum niveocremeum HHB9708]|uniref:ATP-dependent DNA helicase CHL1 n=1 Tax=Sistotremastrum niveocremeum HHB9708 TaxID=1314777 RepID=A0A164YQS1_9AGAM|nr:DNA repair helicase [Sistotremastrum niveocremeum HHB9708]
MAASLRLETPSEFPSFPFTPYDIQLDLMKALYCAIEERKVAVIESPTGTGKTLSLLVGALSWLSDENERAKKGKLIEIEGSIAKGKDPDWVLEQTLQRMKRELEDAEREFQERLEKAKKREEQIRRMETTRAAKRQKLSHPQDDDDTIDEEAFLPEDDEPRPLVASRTKDPAISNDDPTCTKIFYASRTHTQLSQLKIELLKTKHTNTRMVPLGSRRNLCINENVRKQTDLDEACRELQGEKKGKRCPHLPPLDEEAKMLDLRDSILATPKDIEDLHTTGEMMHTCPYFGSRKAIPQAEIVTLPYNLLLHKSARESLGIDLTNHIVIIDEAHNLIDTILSVHSVTLSSQVLSLCLSQIKIYFGRFKTRLTSQHVVHLKRLLSFMTSLAQLCQDHRGKKAKDDIFTVGHLVSQLGSKNEGINLLEIEKYLKSSRIARKISGYCEKKILNGRRRAAPPLHAVEAFILALTGASEDGRVTISTIGDTVQLKYQLLNPAPHFKEVVDSARCVVLAGGTMSPIPELRGQLFSYLPDGQFTVFTCGHIVPDSNLLTLVVGKGPGGGEMDLKMGTRDNKPLLEEVGRAIFNIINLVPDGMVVFFPSYGYLTAAKGAWQACGLMDKFQLKKKIFFEPQDNNEVEEVLRNYASAIRAQQDGTKGGAIMMAVVGARLSEGLNFTDDLARAVILVGLPFANLGSAELKERMRYVNELEKRSAVSRAPGTKDAGTELYENLAMKAVNQSIGRAIRHRNDWAALIFLDVRYGSTRIRRKLPAWLGRDIVVAQTFGQAVKELGAFYRGKRASAT